LIKKTKFKVKFSTSRIRRAFFSWRKLDIQKFKVSLEFLTNSLKVFEQVNYLTTKLNVKNALIAGDNGNDLAMMLEISVNFKAILVSGVSAERL